MHKAGIYIHIPFCNIKCMYCDFYSITKRNDDMPEFIDALIDLQYLADDYISGREFKKLQTELNNLKKQEILPSNLNN